MFLPLIEKRRSIRRYQADPVEPKKIQILVEAALRAPTSMGSQPWSFVVVTDRDLLVRLSRAKPHGSSFLADAPLGIVVAADPARSSVWIEDAAIACTYLQLAAESLGLGTCWIQIRDRMHDTTTTASAYVAETLGIPASLEVAAIVAAGYPAEQKPPHTRQSLPFDRVSFNTFGNPFEVSETSEPA